MSELVMVINQGESVEKKMSLCKVVSSGDEFVM